MNVNLDDYDVRHKGTGAIRLKIPRPVFLPMMLALSHCIERYIVGIEFIVLTSADADDELDELEQAKESAENLKKALFSKLHEFLWDMENGRHYGESYDDRYLTNIPDLERDHQWACGSEKLLADIIEFALNCPMADWESYDHELHDWVDGLKVGDYKF